MNCCIVKLFIYYEIGVSIDDLALVGPVLAVSI